VSGSGFTHAIAGGDGKLILAFVRSPNYDPATGTGWTINKDGTATFYSISLPDFPGSGNKVTFAGTAPASPSVGDVWYDIDAGLQANQWNGTAWVPYSISAGAIAPGDNQNPNPFFAGGDTSTWLENNGAVLTAVATSGISYPWAGQLTAPAGSTNPIVTGPQFAANGGDPIQVNSWFLTNTSDAVLAISFFDASGTFIGTLTSPVAASVDWQYVAFADLALPTSASASIAFGILNSSTSGTEVVQCTATTVMTKVNGALIETGTLAVLQYDGPPGPGNLIASNAGAAGTDQFGNSYRAGIWAYNSAGAAAGMVDSGGQAQFHMVPASATSSTEDGLVYITAINAGLANECQQVILTSGRSGGDDAGVVLNGETADGTGPASILIDLGGTVAASFSKTAIMTNVPVSADSWHDITLDSGWTAGAQAPQYRLLPDGNVQLRGVATHAGTTSATNINSSHPLPASYQPAQTRYYRTEQAGDTAGAVDMGTTGVLVMRASGFSATQAILDGFYSMA
jgi:hypothetical protein